MSSPAEFDTFFFSLLPSVVRMAERMTGDRSSAEDVAAEAFARAYAHWSRVARLDYREAWVIRVAANLAIDLARKGRRRLAPEPGRHASDPSGDVALRVTVVDALRALPRTQRQALVLRYLADLPEQDVAAALGVRPGTVKSHLNRGREAMRSRLGADIEEFEHATRPS